MDVGPGRLPGGGRRQRAESRLPLVQAQLASSSPLQARGWSHLCPQRSPHHLPHTSSSHASLTPSSLLLQSQIGPWGFGPNTYILHIYWTCTCSDTQPFTIPCTLWMEAHGSQVSPRPLSKHGHALPLTVPGLLSCPPPISCPPVRQRAGWGGTGGRCQCPWSRGRTCLAWVRSQKLPPSRNLSRLSSCLTECPRVGQLV